MGFLTEFDHDQHREAVAKRREDMLRTALDGQPALTQDELAAQEQHVSMAVRGIIAELYRNLQICYRSGTEPVGREFLAYTPGSDYSIDAELMQQYDYGRGYAALRELFNDIAREVDDDAKVDIKPRYDRETLSIPERFVGLDFVLTLPSHLVR